MKIFLLLFTLFFLELTLYASSVATITAIRGKADIQRDTKRLPAQLGSDLKQQDSIHTYDNTKLQVIFKDETTISIGNNSDFSIEEYLFDSDKTPIARFGMLRGAIRTITGKIGDVAPQKFNVVTKTATIGIRGTNFTVIVNDDDSLKTFCTYGAISVTIANIMHIVQQGFFLDLSPQGQVTIKAFDAETLHNMKEQYFHTKKRQKTTKTAEKNPNTIESVSSTNDAQLDVTIDDTSGLIFSDIANTTQQIILDNTISLTNNNYIAGLNNTATYTGTHSGTDSVGISFTGNAELTVNFGTDQATLNLTKNNNTLTYSGFQGLNTNTFNQGSLTGDQATGSADGQFYGSHADSVKGTYSYKLNNETETETGISNNDLVTGSGTYSLTK